MIFDYVKIIHIISACILLGSGMGTAFYMFFVNFSDDTSLIAQATAQVVIADWLFTGTSGVVQALTGFTMIYLQHYALTQLWVIGSIAGYLVAGACWLPVVYLQIKCRDMAHKASATQQPLPRQYYRYYCTWCILGLPAFSSLLIVIYFMTQKPVW